MGERDGAEWRRASAGGAEAARCGEGAVTITPGAAPTLTARGPTLTPPVGPERGRSTGRRDGVAGGDGIVGRGWCGFGCGDANEIVRMSRAYPGGSMAEAAADVISVRCAC